jgi:hypothetical protein
MMGIDFVNFVSCQLDFLDKKRNVGEKLRARSRRISGGGGVAVVSIFGIPGDI